MNQIFKIFACLLLTLSIVSPTIANSVIDVDKPVIHQVSTSHSIVAPGETMTFAVNITDASTITYASVSLRPIDRDALEKTVYLKLNSETGLYEGSYTIPTEAFNEKWKVTTVHAKDIHGNYTSLNDKGLFYDNWESTVQFQIFNGIDTVKPTLMGVDAMQIDAMQKFDALENVTAIDDIDGDISTRIHVTGTVDSTKEGIYTLQYRVQDLAGNITTVDRHVQVLDMTAPKLSYPAETIIYEELPFNPLTDVTAIDLYDGDVGSSIKVVKGLVANRTGQQQIVYEVADARGNVQTATRTVTVQHMPDYNLGQLKDIAILQNDSFDALADITILENHQPVKLEVSGAVDTSKLGIYELTYSFQTATKQIVTKTRKIYVVVSLQPYFTGVEDITITFGTNFKPMDNVQAFDATGKQLTNISSGYSGDITEPGTHVIKYEARDSDGRVVKATRNVTVLPHNASFTDITPQHRYFKEIEAMKAQGIINGYENGEFRPAQNISRQHVAVLISRSGVDLTPIRPITTFNDVPTNHRYYNEIMALYRAGIIDGSNGYFNPSGELTRAQLAKILVNTFNLQLQTENVQTFSDMDNAWSKPFVDILSSNNITTGSNGKFLPSDKVSRMHYTVFMYRILTNN